MLFATVPAAPPTRKTQRTTSCPAPISAKVPYHRGSRVILSALEWVSVTSSFTRMQDRSVPDSCPSDSYMFVKSEMVVLEDLGRLRRSRHHQLLPRLTDQSTA